MVSTTKSLTADRRNRPGSTPARPLALQEIRLRDSTADTIPSLAQVLALVAGRVPCWSSKSRTSPCAWAPPMAGLKPPPPPPCTAQGRPGGNVLQPRRVANIGPPCPRHPPRPYHLAYDPDDWAPMPADSAPASAPSRLRRHGQPASSATKPPTLPAPAWRTEGTGAAILCWTIRQPRRRSRRPQGRAERHLRGIFRPGLIGNRTKATPPFPSENIMRGSGGANPRGAGQGSLHGRYQFLDSLSDIPAASGIALPRPNRRPAAPTTLSSPHRFLHALESSGSVGSGTDGRPHPLILTEAGAPVAALRCS